MAAASRCSLSESGEDEIPEFVVLVVVVVVVAVAGTTVVRTPLLLLFHTDKARATTRAVNGAAKQK